MFIVPWNFRNIDTNETWEYTSMVLHTSRSFQIPVLLFLLRLQKTPLFISKHLDFYENNHSIHTFFVYFNLFVWSLRSNFQSNLNHWNFQIMTFFLAFRFIKDSNKFLWKELGLWNQAWVEILALFLATLSQKNYWIFLIPSVLANFMSIWNMLQPSEMREPQSRKCLDKLGLASRTFS